MENYYKIFENIKLDIDTIKKCVNPKKTHVILYQSLYDFNEMFSGEFDSAVVLLHRKDSTGNIYGHFIAIIANKQNKMGEIFDPYGYSYVEMMQLANMNDGLLSDLMRQSQWNFTFNRKQLQKKSMTVNTCGAHCIARVLFKFLTNAEYVSELENLAKKKKIDPDFWVTTIILDSIIR